MSLEVELEALHNADLEQLRLMWRRRYGAPPKLRSVNLLRSILAWRLQVAAESGLDAKTRRLLAKDAAGSEAYLQPGTTFGREWRGIRHDVEVTEAGYLYTGKNWTSLSSIARTITGTRWNGPRFFGLRSEQ